MGECIRFLDNWTNDPNKVKSVFERYKNILESCQGAELSFKARPGVSYSLRGVSPDNKRDLFVMVDVVDDEPAERWLSVCFYDDQVTDDEDLGEWAPGGLNGLDARCFDVDSSDPAIVDYTEARIKEAWSNASEG